MDSTSSVCSSPLIRTKFTGADSSIEYSTRPRESEEQNPETVCLEDRPSTPTILGYEVMEERAKFTKKQKCSGATVESNLERSVHFLKQENKDNMDYVSLVYKILVKKTPEESWVVFRRYTDFSRLNDKLKEMFPGFRLALPPKRWFKDNYNADFLEDRQLGLQAFLQNLVAHKDIANCTSQHSYFLTFMLAKSFSLYNRLVESFNIITSVTVTKQSLAVREFLCLDDPPGPFDSLEESRAFCETLEETNYRFQKELLEKQKEVESLKKLLNEKQLHIDTLENRIRTLSLEPEQSLLICGTEGGHIPKVESSAPEVDRDDLHDESRADDKPCLSLSEPENSVSDIEVAEVAYSAEDD
ncbi:sorting nexin-16 isoform X1 [Prionailurus iriomotensis]